MITILHTSIILLAIIGIFIPLWATFFPKIGVWPLYYLWQLRLTFAIITIGLASWTQVSFLVWIVLSVCFVFYLAVHPKNFLKVLRPPKIMLIDSLQATNLLGDNALVIGTVHNGVARAYPIEEMLVPRHVVEDRVGEQNIVVIFCAACRSGLVYSPMINGQKLTFYITGVYRRNMVIRDYQTHSMWQQATGECIYGKLRGKNLTVLPAEQTTWQQWRTLHPTTTVAKDVQVGSVHLLHLRISRKLLNIPKHVALLGFHGRTDIRLAPHDWIAGIIVNGEARAYPIDILKQTTQIRERVGSVTVQIEYNAAGDRVTAWQERNNTKQALLVDRQWWLGWSEFHPTTSIYQIVAEA